MEALEALEAMEAMMEVMMEVVKTEVMIEVMKVKGTKVRAPLSWIPALQAVVARPETAPHNDANNTNIQKLRQIIERNVVMASKGQHSLKNGRALTSNDER